jgi:hypothetical protein
LACPITSEFFKPVARRLDQIAYGNCRIDRTQFAPGDPDKVRREALWALAIE